MRAAGLAFVIAMAGLSLAASRPAAAQILPTPTTVPVPTTSTTAPSTTTAPTSTTTAVDESTTTTASPTTAPAAAPPTTPSTRPAPTATTFVPPGGRTDGGAPLPVAEQPLPAGTGLLPLFVVLSIGGLAVALVIMGAQYVATRPTTRTPARRPS